MILCVVYVILSMLVGHCPKELEDIAGYNPCIGIDERNPVRQIRSIIKNITHYQELVDLEELDCGNGARVLFEKPFIRTLSHKGQLKNIIKYTHNNPDNAIMREENPDLYVIRRGIVINGLTFDTMGKNRLLDFPIRQTVAISRNATEEKIQQMAEQALREAERGAVTYTVAISEGEKHVAREIREHGMPLIVIMPEGFPPEGTAAARYFHPHGVYHKACGEGRLLILSPSEHNYSLESVVKRTEAELKLRCMARGIKYTPIPHNSKRWRFIACNVMLQMITE